jgi:hypothetical protein
MTEELTDIVGTVLWFATFVTPLVTIPLVWKTFKVRIIYRVLIGVVLALCISFFTYHEWRVCRQALCDANACPVHIALLHTRSI